MQLQQLNVLNWVSPEKRTLIEELISLQLYVTQNVEIDIGWEQSCYLAAFSREASQKRVD